MVDPNYLLFVTILLSAAVAFLLFAVALFLVFVPGANLHRRGFALLLALEGFGLFGAAWPWTNPAIGLIGNPFFYFNRNLGLLFIGTVIGLLYVYPRRPALRSWHTPVFAAGVVLWAAGVGAWMFDRSLLYTGWPAGPGPTTLLFWLVFNPGNGLAQGAMLVSALIRARALPEGQHRAAWLVLPLLVIGTFAFAGANVSTVTLEALGVVQGVQARFVELWASIPGDCCDINLYLMVALIAGYLALAVWAAWHGRWAPAAMVGYGFVLNLFRFVDPAPFLVTQTFLALGVIYVLSRGGLGPIEAPARAWQALAAASLVAGFFLTIGGLVFLAGDPLGFPLAILLALFAGLGAASLALPPGMSLLPGSAATVDPGRVAMYRAALQAELDAGLAGPALAAKLRPLRVQLGLSDREHAMLEHALRASTAGPATLDPGSLFLGRYRVQRLLGQGASGDVYLARDERLGRDVALKRLAGQLRKEPAALARFDRETRLAAALQHPHIVAVHDVETVGEDAYLVMEYVPGGTLAERLATGPLSEAQARAVARDVLDALAALHARGIVHRDVKPSNILLTAEGRAKLADFTVAREAAGGETVGLAARGPVGTFAYMAPEQARGSPAGPASDLYAVGATLYHALAGHPPIAVEGLGEMEARLRLLEAAPDLPLPRVSAGTNAALGRALAKDPAQRFPDAAAMARALGRRSVRAEDEHAPAHADDVAGA